MALSKFNKSNNLRDAAKSDLASFSGSKAQIDYIEPLKKEDNKTSITQKKSEIASEEKPESKKKPAEKKTMGRPKGESTKSLSITIPERLIDDLSTAALIKCRGNISRYFSMLLEEDIANNKASYERKKKILEED